ncbi:MAG: hypothetical protein LBF57_03580 [Holosporaceae bacterium]|jgi:hypothetical protein|nr:hypothetical protein [Holosporaceae bacterium]
MKMFFPIFAVCCFSLNAITVVPNGELSFDMKEQNVLRCIVENKSNNKVEDLKIRILGVKGNKQIDLSDYFTIIGEGYNIPGHTNAGIEMRFLGNDGDKNKMDSLIVCVKAGGQAEARLPFSITKKEAENLDNLVMKKDKNGLQRVHFKNRQTKCIVKRHDI